MQAWFLAGRKFGRPILQRRPHCSARIEKVQGWLACYEATLIIPIRIFVGFGNVGNVAIGMSSLGAPRFTLLNALGALLWATVFAFAGYLLGNLIEGLLGGVEVVEKPLLVGIIVIWVVDHHIKVHLPPNPGARG